jgi:hypothetical protein
VHSIAPLVSRFRHAVWLGEGEHMDGGDVLMVDKRFFIGLSSRTNEAGISRFAREVEKFGYSVQAVPVASGLHLKSVVNYVGAIPCCCRRPRWMNRHSVIFAISCWTRPRNTPATPCGSTTP